MAFDKLFLRKIIKTVAIRCHILKLKCIKSDFGWGSAPDPAGGAYSTPQAPSWILVTSKGRAGACLLYTSDAADE